MHSLETIIVRNAEAAGRAQAHAINAGASPPPIRTVLDDNRATGRDQLAWNAWSAGYARGRQED